MNRIYCCLSAVALALVLSGLQVGTGCALAAEPGPAAGNPVVLVKTTEGSFKVRLFQDKAPITVKNFLQYVDSGFYKGTTFHRVIDGFMIQGGGFTEKMDRKETREPIKNEASAVLKNRRGTIAMARTGVVDSATSQFFINLVDNDSLDHRDETPRGFGYAVFGEVVEGLDVVDHIGKVKTTTVGPYADVPQTPVVIESVERVE